MMVPRKPGDWVTAKLGTVCTVQGGFAFKSESFIETSEGVPVIKIGSLQNGRITIDEKTSRVPSSFLEDRSLQEFLLSDGDVLIAMTGATTGKVGSYRRSSPNGAFLNQRVGRLLPDPQKAELKFIEFATQTPDFQKQILENILAAAQGNISPRKIESIELLLPPLPEQRKIAAVLTSVQQAIEQQERLNELTTELKKALLHRIFSRGLRGEPQEETEIGLVPQSWDVGQLGVHLVEAQYGISVKGSKSGRYPLLRMTNQDQGRVSSDNLQYVEITADQFRKFRVKRGDILFNRTNSFELVGRAALFDLEGEFVFASYLIRLRTSPERLRPEFLNHYLNWDETQRRLKSIATRAVSQSNISASRLRGFAVPVPPIDEQDEIVATLDALDKKSAVHRRKRTVVSELFRTLLHQLMTAQVRVCDVDLSIPESRGVAYQASASEGVQ